MNANEVVSELQSLRAEICAQDDISEDEAARVAYATLLSSVQRTLDLPVSVEVTIEAELRTDEYTLSNETEIAEFLQSNPNVLDEIYANTMPAEYRKKEGQFFTPPAIADFMTSLLPDSSHRILDPACGPGVFEESLTERFADSQELVGIDKDPLMLSAAKVKLALRDRHESVDFECRDFLSDSIDIGPVDAVIGNPPYNKFHGHDNGKASDFDREFSLSMGEFANLYALFFLRASELLAPGGRIVFITPSEYLHTGYGEALKEFFLSKFDVELFVRIDWKDDDVFDALTTACITVLRKGDTETDVRFYVSDSPSDLAEIGAGNGKTDHLKSSVAQSDLRAEQKWTRYFSSSRTSEYLDATVPLQELARVKRGIATGYNDYFTLSKSEVQEWELDDEYLQPVLSKATHAPNYTFTTDDFERLKSQNHPVFLLYYTGGDVSDELQEYVAFGADELDADERYLTRNRDPWFSMEERDPAPILATVFSRDNMRFVHNQYRARNLAAFHCIYPESADETTMKALLAYLNSDVALELAKTQVREYADGLSKFEPGDLADLPTLDLRLLDDNQLETLAGLFDELEAAGRGDGEESEAAVRASLDEVLVEMLETHREKKAAETLGHWT